LTRSPKRSRSQPCGAAESAKKHGPSRAVRLRHVRPPPSERRLDALLFGGCFRSSIAILIRRFTARGVASFVPVTILGVPRVAAKSQERAAMDTAVQRTAARVRRSGSDIVRPRIAGEVRLLQEVDIGPSAEITLGARLMQLSAHGKNRGIRFVNRSARWAAI
jgi:hypothetical protein